MQVSIRMVLKSITITPFLLVPLLSQGIIDPAKAGQDYNVQGDYYGRYADSSILAMQIWAMGEGGFEALICEGGFPGYGWNGKRITANGKSLSAGEANFQSGGHNFKINGAISPKSGEITGVINGKNATLQKIFRKSPSEGRQPPSGAVVLFDGSKESLIKHWPGYSPNDVMTQEGYLTTRRKNIKGGTKFKSHSLHVEYRVPWMPLARKQKRGNSGAYIQARYEIQILDSYTWKPADDHAGGIYSQKACDINAALPPLHWQTYDVQFTQPIYAGKNKTTKGIITVWHNGVKIHDKYQLPRPTPGNSLGETPDGGPFFLQQHGSATFYKNIWVVPDNDALPMVPGCMDKNFAEYNPNADHQPEASCSQKYGCMDPGYAEYDPQAAIQRKGDCAKIVKTVNRVKPFSAITITNSAITIPENGVFKIKGFDIKGKTVLRLSSAGNEKIPLTSKLKTSGLYVIHLHSAKGTVQTKIFHQ